MDLKCPNLEICHHLEVVWDRNAKEEWEVLVDLVGTTKTRTKMMEVSMTLTSTKMLLATRATSSMTLRNIYKTSTRKRVKDTRCKLRLKTPANKVLK